VGGRVNFDRMAPRRLLLADYDYPTTGASAGSSINVADRLTAKRTPR
jgi:hypothetical protein